MILEDTAHRANHNIEAIRKTVVRGGTGGGNATTESLEVNARSSRLLLVLTTIRRRKLSVVGRCYLVHGWAFGHWLEDVP